MCHGLLLDKCGIWFEAKRGRAASMLKIIHRERVELLAHLAIRKAPADEKLRIRIVPGCAESKSGPMLAHRVRMIAPVATLFPRLQRWMWQWAGSLVN